MFSCIDHFREALESIRQHKLRTGLTAFGVAWGIFILVLLMGVGRGLENGAHILFRDDAVNSVWIEGAKTSLPFRGYAPGRMVELSTDDLQAIGQNLAGIGNLTPRKALDRELLVSYGEKSGSFRLYGIYPGYAAVEKTLPLSGRLLNEFDLTERRKTAVIGERVVQLLFGPRTDPVGKMIVIGGVHFQVVGTFTDASGRESELHRIYIPFTTLQETFDSSRSVGLIAFTTHEGYSGEAMLDPIRRLLAERHQFDEQDRAALQLYAYERNYRKFQALFIGLNLFVGLVGLGTLFAGAVGVSNVMLITVKERTREIGIRKALGATPLSILMMIMQEALLITTIAGYCGLVAGVAVIEAIRRSGLRTDFFYDPQVELGVAVGALVILILTGLTAGFLPARQAVHVKTIEALRAEQAIPGRPATGIRR